VEVTVKQDKKSYERSTTAKDDWLASRVPVPRRHLRSLARNTTMLDVDAGTRLCRQGEVPREVFILVDGSASVRRSGELVAALGEGDLFGETSLIRNVPYRSADVVVDTDAQVLVMSSSEFRYLYSNLVEFRTWADETASVHN